jgi:hypothetical protein
VVVEVEEMQEQLMDLVEVLVEEEVEVQFHLLLVLQIKDMLVGLQILVDMQVLVEEVLDKQV